MATIEKHDVPMEKVLNRSKKNGEHYSKRNVVGTMGFPSGENKFTFDTVFFRTPGKLERIIYTSLAALGGIATGLITYFKLIQPLISR